MLICLRACVCLSACQLQCFFFETVDPGSIVTCFLFFLTSSNFYCCTPPPLVLPLLTSHISFALPSPTSYFPIWNCRLPDCFSRHLCVLLISVSRFILGLTPSPLSLSLSPGSKRRITAPMPFAICRLSRKSASSAPRVCLCATVKQGNLEMNCLASFVEQHIGRAWMSTSVSECAVILERCSHCFNKVVS